MADLIQWRVVYDPKLTATERFLFEEMPGRLSRLNQVMERRVVPDFINMMRRQFESEGAAFGHKWQRLAASTLEQKRRLGVAGLGILRRTGRLFARATQPGTLDRRFERIAGGFRLALTVGRVAYAKWHQFGTRNMPQRQIIPSPLPLSFRREVRQAVREWIFTGRM